MHANHMRLQWVTSGNTAGQRQQYRNTQPSTDGQENYEPHDGVQLRGPRRTKNDEMLRGTRGSQGGVPPHAASNCFMLSLNCPTRLHCDTGRVSKHQDHAKDCRSIAPGVQSTTSSVVNTFKLSRGPLVEPILWTVRNRRLDWHVLFPTTGIIWEMISSFPFLGALASS